MYDCAIIGSGPAGISAALTLKARNVNFIWFGNDNLSEKVVKAEKIRNYPGLTDVSGKELYSAFKNQLDSLGITITNKIVTGIYDMGSYYGILCNQEMFEAKAIILAMGVASIKEIDGELDYLGRGVSYCATCDGFLYKNKEIAILAESREYLGEVDYLANLASKVTLIPLFKDYVNNNEKINVIVNMPKKIEKNERLNILFKDNKISVDGFFILKSAIAPTALIPGIKTENNHILVDRAQKTNMNGVFACGDITGRPYQYAKAVGEGNVAAHSVVEYLNKR